MDYKQADQDLEALPGLLYTLGESPIVLEDLKDFLHKTMREAYELGHATAILNKNKMIGILMKELRESADKVKYVGEQKRKAYMMGFDEGKAIDKEAGDVI